MLRGYLRDQPLARGTAARVLTLAFLGAFSGHVTAVTAVTIAVVLVAGRQDAPNTLLTWVLLIAAYANLAVAALIAAIGQSATLRGAERTTASEDREQAAAQRPNEPRDPSSQEPNREERRRQRALRQSALAQTLFVTVLLTTPGWFLAFAWLTGQPRGTLLALMLALAIGYGVGLIQIRPLVHALARPPSSATEAG